MEPTSLNRPATPQQHSHDYLVRVTAAALQAIVFEHYCTLQDSPGPGSAPPQRRVGLTEWVGQAAGARVSLGWDWQQLDDGQALALQEVPPRSNLMVVDARGYDLPPAEVARHLWQVVRQIPWESYVQRELDSGFACLEPGSRFLM